MLCVRYLCELSVKTCSVKDLRVLSVFSLGPVSSDTSMASVASSADCDTAKLLHTGAVGAKHKAYDDQYVFSQIQNIHLESVCSPWLRSCTGVSVREEQLLRTTLQLVAQPTMVIPANMPSTPPFSSEAPSPACCSRNISPAG